MQYILYNIYIYIILYIYIYFFFRHSGSFFDSIRRTEYENPKSKKRLRQEKYRACILVNESSTSTLVEELINISINLLSPAIQSVSISGQQTI